MSDIEIVAAVCPRCGADLKIPENLAKAHCIYCGAEVLIAGAKPAPQKVRCKTCGGIGRLDVCAACGGRGTCNCGDGYCSVCRGHGTVYTGNGWVPTGTCQACMGTGMCPNCRGTRKCITCKGLGMFPSPTGSVKCSVCAGSGLVDAEKADGGKPDKCPNCGKPWPSGGEFCPSCGFAKSCPRCGVPWNPGAMFCPHCGHRRGTRV